MTGTQWTECAATTGCTAANSCCGKVATSSATWSVCINAGTAAATAVPYGSVTCTTAGTAAGTCGAWKAAAANGSVVVACPAATTGASTLAVSAAAAATALYALY